MQQVYKNLFTLSNETSIFVHLLDTKLWYSFGMDNNIQKQNEAESQRQQKARAIAGALGILAVLLLLGWLVGAPLVRFAGDPDRFRAWVDASGPWSRVLFVAMVVVQLVLAFLPGEPFEVAAGYAFGFFEGTLLCLLGTFLGGALVFLAVRRYGTKLVAILFPRNRLLELKILKDPRRRTLLMLLLYLLPGTPKDFITYFAGLTDIKFWHFILISTLARLPSVVTSTAGGHAIGEEAYTMALAAFGAALLLALVGTLIYRRMTKDR